MAPELLTQRPGRGLRRCGAANFELDPAPLLRIGGQGRLRQMKGPPFAAVDLQQQPRHASFPAVDKGPGDAGRF